MFNLSAGVAPRKPSSDGMFKGRAQNSAHRTESPPAVQDHRVHLTHERRRPMTTWLITGCSTGLGRAFAEAVLAGGDNAVVTARTLRRSETSPRSTRTPRLAFALDVTDDAQVTAAVAAADERFGGVDVLVNNAGYGYRAAVEEGEDDAVRHSSTPTCSERPHDQGRAAGYACPPLGHDRELSSIGARICPEGSGYYSAVKAAIEALTLSLRKEVAPLGITAMVVEPGAFRTDFAGRRSPRRPSRSPTTPTPPADAVRSTTPCTEPSRAIPPSRGGPDQGGRVRRAAVHAAARRRRLRRLPCGAGQSARGDRRVESVSRSTGFDA